MKWVGACGIMIGIGLGHDLIMSLVSFRWMDKYELECNMWDKQHNYSIRMSLYGFTRVDMSLCECTLQCNTSTMTVSFFTVRLRFMQKGFILQKQCM